MRPRTDFWLTVVLFLVLGAPACAPPTNYDLAITNVRIFDVHTGQTSARSTILIRHGLIASIVADSLSMAPDSIRHYREDLAQAYLRGGKEGQPGSV